MVSALQTREPLKRLHEDVMYSKDTFDVNEPLENLDLHGLTEWAQREGACEYALGFLRCFTDITDLIQLTVGLSDKELEEYGDAFDYLDDTDTMQDVVAGHIVWMCRNALGDKRWPAAEYIVLKSASAAAVYAQYILCDRFREAESIIAQYPPAACPYAWTVLKGERFPEAEPYIAKCPSWALVYASIILKGERFEAAEPYIVRDTKVAPTYAKRILGHRWEACEEAIIKEGCAFTALNYIRDFIKTPHPPFEPILAKSPHVALEYAKRYLPQGFPAGEPAISRASRESLAYAQLLGDRFPAGEPAIATCGESSLEYAEKILKDRFPLGEWAILNRGSIHVIRRYHNLFIQGRWDAFEEKFGWGTPAWNAYKGDLKEIGILLD